MKVTEKLFKSGSEIVGVNISDPVQESYYNWTHQRLLDILAKDIVVPSGTPIYVLNIVGYTSDYEIMELLRDRYCSTTQYRVSKWYYGAWTKVQSLATLRPMSSINRHAIVKLVVNEINRTSTDYKLTVQTLKNGCLQVMIKNVVDDVENEDNVIENEDVVVV